MGNTVIIGQERILRILRAAREAGTVSHAYLFYGPEGCGKKTISSMFAQALNCSAFPDGPCGNCTSCRKAAAGNHPDIHFVWPDGKTLKIEQVRQLRKEVFLKPHEGRCQVFILDATAAVTPEAANSLLRMLEDPPPATVFILLALNPSSLPPTIISRCQLLPLERLSPAELGMMLENVPELTSVQRELAIHLAEGIPGRALEAAKQWETQIRDAEKFLCTLAATSSVTALAAELSAREKPDDFIQVTLTLLRDLAVLGLTGSTEIMLCRQAEQLQELAGKWPAEAALKALEAFLDLQKNLRSPVNLRLAVEQTLRLIKEEV